MRILTTHESAFFDNEKNIMIAFVRTEHVVDIHTFYDEIATALFFPDYYGRNLDALEEMLNDLAWLDYDKIYLIIRETQVLPIALEAYYSDILDILQQIENEKLIIIKMETD